MYTEWAAKLIADAEKERAKELIEDMLEMLELWDGLVILTGECGVSLLRKRIRKIRQKYLKKHKEIVAEITNS